MLDHDLERLGGPDGLTRVMMFKREMSQTRLLRQLEGNARPWRFMDSTLDDRVRGK